MPDRFEIVQYTPALKETLVELQTHLWSSDRALNAAYLEWKYERNPYSSEPLIWLAMNQGKAVGMRGVFATKWQVGSTGHTLLIPYPDDLVIDPKYRNQGLIAKIMNVLLNDLSKRGFGFVLNLSAGPVTTLSSLAMGWQSTGSMEPMTLKGPDPLGLKLRQKLSKTPLLWRLVQGSRSPYSKTQKDPFLKLDRKQRFGQKFRNGFSVERLPQPEAMAALVNRLAYDGRLRHVRDVEYLKWRFQNPLRSYRFLFAWKEGQLRGYLVLQSYVSDLSDKRRVNLVDWEGEDLETKAQLLQTAVQQGQFQDLFTWAGTFSSEVKQILQGAGFVPIEQTREQKYRNYVLVRRTEDRVPGSDWVVAGKNLLEMNNWDLRLIYSMHG